MNNDVTVILNGFRRGASLNEQYEALKNQSIVPKKIMLWYNHPDRGEVNYAITSEMTTALCNENLGVWARFAYALNASTEYIMMLDDDMIPGNKWVENNLNTIYEVNGLLGGVGLIYKDPIVPVNYCSYYDPYHRYGWVDNGQSNYTQQVDFVGHSWFFRREWLSTFWREMPDPRYFTCGEDYHFSYMLQKYEKILTYVPKHPVDDKSMWSNIAHVKYAADNNSLWETNQKSPAGVPFKKLMNEGFIEQRKKGWKLMNEI